MYLIDDNDLIVDSECSLDLLSGEPCVVVESSGGASPSHGVMRRNPGYNKLVTLILTRLAQAKIQITRVVLDSSKVAHLPISERTANLATPYPIDLSMVDVDEFRKMLGREIASMHREPTAQSGGNAQKRMRICLDRQISPDLLISQPGGAVSPDGNIEPTPGLSETERQYLRLARVGQGKFREGLLQKYGGICAVTGIAHQDLLIASHIKPWKACNNFERLDPHNGILLSALLDRLFDKGLITFNDMGQMVVSPRLSVPDKARCSLESGNSIKLSDQSQIYMEYHRMIEFKKS